MVRIFEQNCCKHSFCFQTTCKVCKIDIKITFYATRRYKSGLSMKRNRKSRYEWCYYQQNDACDAALCGNITTIFNVKLVLAFTATLTSECNKYKDRKFDT